MSIYVIIGKNFGDEGKGLAVDYFAARSQTDGQSCVVIRHNGGGQAGHTVDLPDKRFVFHQLSSGSFRNADTYWSQTFLPDLYKLHEETEAFAALCDKHPRIIGHPRCRCVYIDDVLVNMAVETARGNNRHGSCGMGIHEAVTRSNDADDALLLGDVASMTASTLYHRLLRLRREYLPKRLHDLGLTVAGLGDYASLLTDDNVLANAAEEMCRGVHRITVADDAMIGAYDNVVFEGAQGLLLDEDCAAFLPHVTSSKTGCHNPLSFVQSQKLEAVPELVYVTRSYVTRHGAGPLPHEASWDATKYTVNDPTNLPNPWQGTLRAAPHGTQEDFFTPIKHDVASWHTPYSLSCMITHLNETNGTVYSVTGDVATEDWFENTDLPFSCLYLSDTPYARDVRACRI